MSKCLVTSLDCNVNISNPDYLGELRVNIPACSLTLRPTTGNSITATFEGSEIGEVTTIPNSGELIISNKYVLKVIQGLSSGSYIAALSQIETNKLEYCEGMTGIKFRNLLKGDIYYLRNLSSLESLEVPFSTGLYGNIVDIAACPITMFNIYNSQISGTIEKYVAERIKASGSTSGSFQYSDNLGNVTFDGVKPRYGTRITFSWSPNGTNPSYTDITFDPSGTGEKTITIDSDGNKVS